MTSSLDIAALAVVLPDQAEHSSKLGTMMPSVYHHLYDASGNFSRPPVVRRGVTTIWSKPFTAPTAAAQIRSSDLAAQATAKVATAIWDAASTVGAVFHNQCTLDQQIVGSTCLRLEQQYFPASRHAMTLGQLGTAGLPTAFEIARQFSLGESATPLIAVTACDKWIAPFFRTLSGSVFADSGGSALVAASLPTSVARVEAIATICGKALPDVWRASTEQARQYLADIASKAIAKLTAQLSSGERANLLLVGDGHGADVSRRIADACGIAPLFADDHPAHALHLSSASAIQAISHGIKAAVSRGQPVRVAVWTASLSGHAGALLVTCHPHAIPINGGWSAMPVEA